MSGHPVQYLNNVSQWATDRTAAQP